jgi:hypothetical protein
MPMSAISACSIRNRVNVRKTRKIAVTIGVVFNPVSQGSKKNKK